MCRRRWGRVGGRVGRVIMDLRGDVLGQVVFAQDICATLSYFGGVALLKTLHGIQSLDLLSKCSMNSLGLRTRVLMPSQLYVALVLFFNLLSFVIKISQYAAYIACVVSCKPDRN